MAASEQPKNATTSSYNNESNRELPRCRELRSNDNAPEGVDEPIQMVDLLEGDGGEQTMPNAVEERANAATTTSSQLDSEPGLHQQHHRQQHHTPPLRTAAAVLVVGSHSVSERSRQYIVGCGVW